MSNMTLTMEFDPRTALRLAKYEAETGLSLADLLVAAVEKWEEVSAEGTEELAKAPYRVPVQFDYTPRSRPRRRFQARGLYDPRRHEIEITDTPPELASLRGHRGTPSDAAIRVVSTVNPDIVPNRNGNDAWKETRTGRTVGDLQREFRNSLGGR